MGKLYKQMSIKNILQNIKKFRWYLLSLLLSFIVVCYLHIHSTKINPNLTSDIFDWLILEVGCIFCLNLFLKKEGNLIKKIVTFLFIEIFLFALKIRFLIPLLPTDVYDCYQDIAINFYKYHHFIPFHRSVYYPLIFFFTSNIGQSLSAIIPVQIFLSFFSAILFTLLIIRTSTLLNPDNKAKKTGIFYILGLITFFLFTLSNQRIRYEYAVRPELISQFIEILMLFLIFKIIKKDKSVNLYLISLVSISIFAIYFQIKFLFYGIFNIIISINYIVFSLQTKKNKIMQFIFFVILPLLLFISFNFFVNRFFSDINKQSFESHSLYVRNQKNINKVMVQDYYDYSFNKYDKKILKQFIDFYETKSHFYPNNENMKIRDLDNIITSNGPNFHTFAATVIPNYSDRTLFLKYYFEKFLNKYPFDFFMSYFYEMRLVYNPLHPLFFNKDYVFPFVNDINIAKSILAKYHVNIPIVDNYLKSNLSSYYPQGIVYVFMLINPLLYTINLLYLPLTSIFCILFVFAWFRSKKRWIASKKIGLLTLYSILSAFFMYSATAVGHLYCNRYTYEIFPLFLAGEIFTVIYFFSFVSRQQS